MLRLVVVAETLADEFREPIFAFALCSSLVLVVDPWGSTFACSL